MGVVATVNLYAIALDTRQWELFDDVFTDDVSADYGGGAVWQGLANLRRDFAAIHAPFFATQHVTTNHAVALDGDRAHCLSYVHGRFIREVGEGGNLFESGGWYDDALVRDGARWLISSRVCRSIWAAGNPAVLATQPEVTGVPRFYSLAEEAAAGSVAALRAIRG